MKKQLDFKSVYECNRCLGCETLHPQASIINLENRGQGQGIMKFEFYAILLIEDCPDECCCCGRKYYDYSSATMVFLKPGEVFRLSENNMLPNKGYLLAFHPDLLFHTSLKSQMRKYTFFSYYKEEALHLSQRETAKVVCCLENIEDELHHPIDTHSNTILSCHIELLLDYCKRYYERQFITRENKDKLLLEKLDRIFEDYVSSGRLQQGEGAASDVFAEMLGLSPAYFIDMLKFETGKSWDEYFQWKRLDMAKRMLLQVDATPANVAYRLGYPSVQYFALLFKKVTGMAPADYRCSQN